MTTKRWLGKQLGQAEKCKVAPDTESGKMKNVMRYVSGQSPAKRPALSVKAPGK